MFPYYHVPLWVKFKNSFFFNSLSVWYSQAWLSPASNIPKIFFLFFVPTYFFKSVFGDDISSWVKIKSFVLHLLHYGTKKATYSSSNTRAQCFSEEHKDVWYSLSAGSWFISSSSSSSLSLIPMFSTKDSSFFILTLGALERRAWNKNKSIDT